MNINPKFDIDKVRDDFPILKRNIRDKPLIYLDNAATTQKPSCVLDAVKDFYSEKNANVHRGVYLLSEEATSAYENARKYIASFINANSENEIVFLRGVTEAINLVANSYGTFLNKGDEIILTQMEHHANIVPWQILAQQKQLKIQVVPLTDDNQLDLDAFSKMLNEKTKMVAVTFASNILGSINPVKKITQLAHDAGATVLIDAAQAPAHLAIDVQEIDCDFLTFSAHKHFGPTGIGILFGKESLLEKMPPYQGGGSMIEKVDFKESTYLKPPLRFEAGTPAYAEAVGMEIALRYISKIGIDAIKEFEDALSEYAIQQFSKHDYIKLYGPSTNRLAVFSFSIKDVHPHDVATILDADGIAVRAGHHCAMPLVNYLKEHALIRASLAMYNTKEDLDVLFSGLTKIKKLFKI